MNIDNSNYFISNLYYRTRYGAISAYNKYSLFSTYNDRFNNVFLWTSNGG